MSYGPKWEENPSPKRLERLVGKCTGSRKDYLNILIDQGRAMAILNGDDLYLSVYDPVSGCGSFLDSWQPLRGSSSGNPSPTPKHNKKLRNHCCGPEFFLFWDWISRWRR